MIDEIIRKKKYDFGLVASFGHMIPSFIIDRFKTKDTKKPSMMVMHPSLLPKFRGACPIQY